MFSQIERLLSFARAHTHLICYGAGRYAKIILPFLKQYGITCDYCLVSGSVSPGKNVLGVPYQSVKTFQPVAGRTYGVILALQPMYHADALAHLNATSGLVFESFCVAGDDIDDIATMARQERRRVILMEPVNLDFVTKQRYDARIAEIKSHYRRMLLRYIDLRVIGSTLSWIYYVWQRERLADDGLYWVFYPVSNMSKPEWELTGANTYLASKLTTEGMEVISKNNLAFWQYFLQKEMADHGDFLIIDDGFSLLQWWKILDNFCVQHRFDEVRAYIRFTPEEEAHGRARMKELGIREPYVCFFVRDGGYNKNVFASNNDLNALSRKYRDADVRNMRLAMEGLKQHGIQAVRVGVNPETSIDWDNTIDYASYGRDEFMDVYLAAHCLFFICTPSGIQALPSLFMKPQLSIDMTVLSQRHSMLLMTTRERDMAIFKKYWLPSEQRYLSFKEMLQCETDTTLHDKVTGGTYLAYERMGIEPQENTPEEIRDAVEEMVRRMDGTMTYTAEEIEMQKKAFAIVDGFPMHHNFPFIQRTGIAFLKAYPELLE